MGINESAATLVANGWHFDHEANGVRKGFRFSDFDVAFQFMTEVASVAEALNHHPDWRNVYATVEILLTTHDVGAVSDLDVTLGASIDSLCGTYEGSIIDL